jgi:signal transduction histidine kinase
MGGRIDIESKIIIGTTVTVVLPPKRALDEARAHAA